MTSVAMVILGIALLAASLITRHVELNLFTATLIWLDGWAGAILVVIGTGRIFFLDD
jgi:hypothetical protein